MQHYPSPWRRLTGPLRMPTRRAVTTDHAVKMLQDVLAGLPADRVPAFYASVRTHLGDDVLAAVLVDPCAVADAILGDGESVLATRFPKEAS